MGSQFLSTTPNTSGVPKTTMERDKWQKVFVSAAHTRFDAGVDSPGPAYFVDTNSRGGDTLGRGTRKKLGWSFGRQPQR